MKFIKGKLSLLGIPLLLCFIFMFGLNFAPGPVCLQYVASANSYYWTLFGLEGLYAVLQDFWSIVFLKSAV